MNTILSTFAALHADFGPAAFLRAQDSAALMTAGSPDLEHQLWHEKGYPFA